MPGEGSHDRLRQKRKNGLNLVSYCSGQTRLSGLTGPTHPIPTRAVGPGTNRERRRDAFKG